MNQGAEFSEDRKYRYALWRRQCLSFEFDGFQAVALKHYKWLEKLA